MTKSLISVVLCATLAQANIFSIDVTNDTNNQGFSDSFESVKDSIDSLDTNSIKSNISYADTDQVSALLNFRGLPVNLSYAQNSTTLVLDIDSIGINETFTGLTRDDSADALVDWLKSNGSSAVEKMMKKLAEVSAIDPIAGNPNSLMGMTVSNDFTNGFMNIATKQQNLGSSSSSNNIYIAPSYSAYDVDGIKSSSYSLPLAYSFNFDRNINEKITISLPISYTEVEGSESVSLGLGIAYSYPVNKNWILTPAVSYGASGSIDLGAFAQIASASLTSAYKWDLGDDYTLNMGNMIGYYSTVKLYDGDYAYDPEIRNTVYRNALMVNIPTNSMINNTSLEIYAIDTRYTGSALYMEEYQEYGFSYGYDAINLNILSDNEKYAVRKNMKIGISYLTSDKADGFKVNLGFIF